jgi:hypothetical protein
MSTSEDSKRGAKKTPAGDCMVGYCKPLPASQLSAFAAASFTTLFTAEKI